MQKNTLKRCSYNSMQKKQYGHKIFNSILILIFLIIANACTYIQYPFPGEIKGSEARNMIMDTIITTEILIYSQYPNLIRADSPYYNALITNMMFDEQEMTGNVFLPAFIRIDEKKMYKKETVEKCIEIIQFQGLINASIGVPFPDIIATISCDVQEASILQIGKAHIL